MKVAIVAPTPVPFTRGGAERAWAGLHAALLDDGHDAEMVKLPVRERTLGELSAAYRSFSTLDLTHFDAVISSKYPAWMCPHPRHVLWLFHPLRGLYDTYAAFGLPTAPGPVSPATARLLAAVEAPPRREAVPEVLDLLDAALAEVGADGPELAHPGPVARLVVRWLDRTALDPREMSRHVALSRTVAARADYLPPGVATLVAHAPSDLPPAGDGRALEDLGLTRDGYAFTASRLDGPKRLDLLVEAWREVPGDMPLVIGGTGPEEARLRALAAGDPRVRLAGFVPDDALAELYAGARVVPFLPADEDYGLITVEAMAAGTPVVTCTDSGGPTEIVRSAVDGIVTAPRPRALAAALSELVGDAELARAMGSRARRRVARITWGSVVRTLLPEADGDGSAPPPRGETAPARPMRPGLPRVVVLTTFRVADRGHGGQLRAFHLYGALAASAEVEVVSLVDDGPEGSVELRPGLVETAVRRSPEHVAAGEALSAALGTPVTDLVAGRDVALTPAHQRALRSAARHADLVVLAEPYMLPALDAAGIDLPVVYDAYNVETDLKADVYPRTGRGPEALAAVRAVEVAALHRASRTTACSHDDARRLAALGGLGRAAVSVVPNGTDCSAVHPPSAERRAEAGRRWLARMAELRPEMEGTEVLAVFFGSWHPPNLDAAEVIMRLAPELPEVAFVLGGRHGDAFAERALPRNVVLTSVVTDRAKETLLRSAHVALNPMTFGSGTNLKVLEYLAAGVPVVSTAVGARGLDVVDGEHLLITDRDGPAAAIRAVARDPEAAAARARAGRALVEERYDWTRLGALLGDVVAELVPSAASGGAGTVR